MPVRIIPVRQPEVRGTAALLPRLRVCAYCRVSTDNEDQETSYEAQVAHYTDYITKHDGWELVGIFADEGISGTSIAKREQFNRMIAACEAGEVDMVITKSISRWARNTIDSIQNIRKLKALGIPVLFEKENCNTMESSGELLLTILSSLAQQESQSISQNVRIGLQYGFQRGKPMLTHTTFLGYTKERGDKELTIVPEEAEIVRRIFRDYLEGYTFGEIKEMLEKDGVKTGPGRSIWYHSTIVSMLKNEKYMGDLLLQKSYVVDFLTKERAKNYGEFPQYYVENAHPPIVPKEVFMRVQGELMRHEQLKREGAGRPTLHIPLNGKIICGQCGAGYRRCASPYTETVWRCRHNNGEKNCKGRAILEKAVKDAIVVAFNQLPKCKENLIRMYERIQWGPLDQITRELEAIDERKGALEGIISDYAATGCLNQRTIFLYSDEVGASEKDAIERIKKELDELAFQRDNRLMDKAELAVQEVQIRSLLKLIERIKPTEETRGFAFRMHGSAAATSTTPCSEQSADSAEVLVDHAEQEQKNAACYDLFDFYDRTDRVDQEGPVTEATEDLIKRYIASVTVNRENLVIRFKAGAEITVDC